MEFKPKAMAEVAGMAAMTANANAVHARLAADSAAAYARRLEIDAKAKAYGFSHDDVLRALDAAAPPRFAVGGVYPGDLLVSKDVAADHMAALQSAAFNPWPEMLAASREILRLNTQIANLLQRWDSDVLPSSSNPL
ncbi:hypothetical protein N5C96_29430 [Delftia tsuruhatensis]|uniref:hypothetical protein n=1 Tax=Delftia tsuruhatensis TaxID=180282 RepID=UPI002444554C|nr:hypothetical protein [Delftia tsuruhatensis]MDH0777542.1 hypothetical protein [Delftia tsuruhatensis]MDH1461878.1 hypothetical protein [Delftia tsuruhatensis]WGG09943.1 hypothetical protein N5O86_25365 [Delftia tsuruhatensis]